MRKHIIPILLTTLLLGAAALPGVALAQQDSLRAEMLRGNVAGMEDYIDGLSRSQRRTFANRVRLTEMGLAHYDLEEAKAQLEGLRSLRRLTEEQEQVIERLADRITTMERITNRLATMQLYTITKGSEAELLERLGEEMPLAGQLSRRTFVTADGRERWQVLSDTTGVDRLQVVTRLGDGSWDDRGAETIEILGLEGGAIAFPFLMADGETIRFAYRGPESLGGYDLFVSRYDRSGGRLLIPQQLSAPFNTSADDLLLLGDEERGVDWLLTDRGTSGDSLVLYALSHERRYGTPLSAELGWLLGDSIAQSGAPLPPRVTPQAVGSREERVALFWIDETPIYDRSSLTGREAQHFLGAFIQRKEDLDAIRARLASLREAYPTNRSLKDEILTLEQKERQLSSNLTTLRNRVIELEKSHK